MVAIRCRLRSPRSLAVADVLSLAAAGFALAAGIVLVMLLGVSTVDDGSPLLLLPPAMAAAPVFARGAPFARPLRVAVAIVLTGFWFAAAPSLGWFFAPSALFAISAAAVPDRRRG
jgi:hypothetical protein